MNKHEKPKQLNLKDAETRALADELAKLHGETLNGVVKSALREKLVRDRRTTTKEARLSRLMALSRESAARIGPRLMSDEDAVGYDEFGLPS